MSLRLRLTLIFTCLLSGVIALLSIVIYSIVSVVMINQVDMMLESGAGLVIEYLTVDDRGRLVITGEYEEIADTFTYQVWSQDQQLLLFSDPIGKLTDALDDVGLGQRQPVFREQIIEQSRYRVLTVPLNVNGDEGGWIQVGFDMAPVRQAQYLFLGVFGFSALFSVIISIIIGWLITGQVLEPLVSMTEITNRITSTNDLSQRIPVEAGRDDEISRLVLTFNQTLVRLERLFNAQRRFLADVSHELRTPLTVIKGNVGLMRMMNTMDEEALTSIESEVDRLTRLVGDLLLMAQAESGQLPIIVAPVELDELIFEVFNQMKVLSDGMHDIRVSNVEPAIVMGDRDRLKQVLINLGSNAVKFTPQGKKISLSLAVRHPWVEISIKDEGVGIPEQERKQLFERFYREDKARTRTENKTGFGLGLPIAYWIVRSHGGRIEVESVRGEGTTFTIWLPFSLEEIPTRPIRSKLKKRE